MPENTIKSCVLVTSKFISNSATVFLSSKLSNNCNLTRIILLVFLLCCLFLVGIMVFRINIIFSSSDMTLYVGDNTRANEMFVVEELIDLASNV